MSDFDELTRPSKRKPKTSDSSKNLLQQNDNSILDISQFTQEITDEIAEPKTAPTTITASNGSLNSRMGDTNITQANQLIDNIQWTPAKKILTFLLTGGSYAGIIVALYLTGVKELAIIFGATTMSVFLMVYIIYWITKG